LSTPEDHLQTTVSGPGGCTRLLTRESLGIIILELLNGGKKTVMPPSHAQSPHGSGWLRCHRADVTFPTVWFV
jgi:hypothetical protein